MTKIDYQKELNEEQLRVVQSGDGPCLVLAGAGTGKTRTIVYRVAYLLEKGVKPENILLVTFTNKAAKEMLRRVEVLFGDKPAGLWGGTFHHMGNAILRRYGRHLGISPDFTIMDEDDSHSLLSSIMAEFGLANKYAKNYFPKASVLRGVLSFATNSQRKLEEVVEERLPDFVSQMAKIKNIAVAYEQRKKIKNLVDFDDLLLLWRRLLVEFPQVAEKLSEKFQHILIDEYQDTNRLQGLIVEELARHHKNILVVGDDAQSIYAFRAATVENILNFPKIFPQARMFHLRENYRSTSNILDLANQSIRNNWKQFEKDLQSVRGGGVKPELWALPNKAEEARFVVGRILDLHEEGESLLNMAILFRAVFHTIEIELELQKRGVPYIMRGGVRFFEQAHIKDIVAYLKILQNPTDELAWRRILKLEEGIGEVTAAKIINSLSSIVVSTDPPEAGSGEISRDTYVAGVGSLDFARDDKVKVLINSHPALGRILKRLAKMKGAQSDIREMITIILDEFYENYISANFEDAKQRIEDSRQLAEFSHQYKELQSFLTDATLSEGFRNERAGAEINNENQEYLVLSTIHQAKGLEWKDVFVVGLVEGQFPHYKSYKSRGELEEERRLFYVACTRAKDHLCLTYPVSSENAFFRPSTFIEELNPDLLQCEEMEEVIDIDADRW